MRLRIACSRAHSVSAARARSAASSFERCSVLFEPVASSCEDSGAVWRREKRKAAARRRACARTVRACVRARVRAC
eukprot:3382305-Pleurochrysis_carterae.AAC.2